MNVFVMEGELAGSPEINTSRRLTYLSSKRNTDCAYSPILLLMTLRHNFSDYFLCPIKFLCPIPFSQESPSSQ